MTTDYHSLKFSMGKGEAKDKLKQNFEQMKTQTGITIQNVLIYGGPQCAQATTLFKKSPIREWLETRDINLLIWG